MFKTIFVKQVFDSSEVSASARFAVLQREDLLPFAPSPGHEFFWTCERSQKVVTATWNFEGAHFSCKVEDELVEDLGMDSLDFDELIEQAQINGWKLIKIFDAQ